MYILKKWQKIGRNESALYAIMIVWNNIYTLSSRSPSATWGTK